MSHRPGDPPDPRKHALRTLAALLVRHGPTTPAPEPPEAAGLPESANQAEPARKAA
jgi:hypothetical protein